MPASSHARAYRRTALVAIVLVGLAVAAAVRGVRDHDAPDHAVVWAVGDGADGSAGALRVADMLRRQRVDRLLYLGDVYGPDRGARAADADGTAADFRQRYDTVYGDWARRTVATPGDHEWGNRNQGYVPYWARVNGRPPQPYHAVSVAGWEILSLNSEDDHGPTSSQVRWLRRQLRDGRGTCRIAIWHRPRFSAGKHGDQPDVTPLWDAFRGRGVLVLSGNDHNMQRFRPVDGVTQVVSGAGGRSNYPLRADDRLAFGDDERDGALRIDLRPRSARLAFVDDSGRVLDRTTLACR